MANNSLAQSCAFLHEIDQQTLEEIHSNINQATAVLDILVSWMSERGFSPSSLKDYGNIQTICFLLIDLLVSAEEMLPEA